MSDKGPDVTATPNLPAAHRGLCSAFRHPFLGRGRGGLYCGTLLAPVGVSNGVLHVMACEKTKRWAFEHRRRSVEHMDDRPRRARVCFCITFHGASPTPLDFLCPIPPLQSCLAYRSLAHYARRITRSSARASKCVLPPPPPPGDTHSPSMLTCFLTRNLTTPNTWHTTARSCRRLHTRGPTRFTVA